MLITFLPLLDSVRFHPIGVIANPRYHTKHFDDTSYMDGIKYYQTRYPYYQKWQQSDRITFEVNIQKNNTAVLTLELLTNTGGSLGLIANSGTVTAAGNVDPVTGTQYKTYLFSFIPSAYNSGTDGIYFLVLHNHDDLGDSEDFLSEPLDIRAAHNKTVLIEYANNTNYNDIIVNGFPLIPKFGFRVEGDLRQYNPLANVTSYKDQSYNTQNQKQTAWRGFRFMAGGLHGVPDWVIDKLSQIFTCDNVAIDGKGFTYDAESSGGGGNTGTVIWQDDKRSDVMPLSRKYIQVTETGKTGAITFRGQNTLPLFTRPHTYPYAIGLNASTYAYLMHNGPTYIGLTTQVIEDSAGETAFLNYYNTVIVGYYGLTGTFSFVGDIFTYSIGPGETWYSPPFGSVLVLEKALLLTVGTANAVTAGQVSRYAQTTGNSIVDFGDSTVNAQVGSGSQIRTYAASQTLPKGVRIFFSATGPQITGLNLDYIPSTGVKITLMAGHLPAQLQTLSVNGNDFSGAPFDPTILYDAEPFLQSINFGNCGITSFASRPFQGHYFQSLSYIIFGQNALTTTDIDHLYNDYWSLFAPILGVFATNLQTTGQTASSASLTSRNDLIVYGWTIFI